MLVDQTTKNQGSKAQKNYSGNVTSALLTALNTDLHLPFLPPSNPLNLPDRQ
jgi:hypothetical protein